jgi:NADH-quinone oxidoreductase subunit E
MKNTTTEKILLEFEPERKNLLPALKTISAAFGFISEKDAVVAANYFRLPVSAVYETASFYDELHVKRQSTVVLKVCSGTHCAVQSAFSLIQAIEQYFRIKANDDANQKVKLEIVSCLGQCGEGPILIINDTVFTKVSSSSLHDILRNYL